METLKFQTSRSEALLSLQNGEEQQSYCDLRLICSDGYIPIHKSLLPKFTSGYTEADTSENCARPSPHHPFVDQFSSEIVLPNLTISQASKLAFLVYTGETLISKSDQQALRPLLGAFQISRFKMVSFPPTIPPNTRARRSSGMDTSTSSKEILAKRKVRGVKTTNEVGEGRVLEHVFIFGDGSTSEILESSENACNGSLFYDENGILTSFQDGDDNDRGNFCESCSFIFCDSSDYLVHANECAASDPVMPPTATPKINIKVETDHDIKVETTTTIIPAAEDSIVTSGTPRPIVSTINVCLVCVTSCKDPSELIVHSNEKHHISPDKDYDIGAWKCKRCKSIGSSNELSVFLQHVYHCQQRQVRLKRKRSTKEEEIGVPAGNYAIASVATKRRRTCSPPIDTAKDDKHHGIPIAEVAASSEDVPHREKIESDHILTSVTHEGAMTVTDPVVFAGNTTVQTESLNNVVLNGKLPEELPPQQSSSSVTEASSTPKRDITKPYQYKIPKIPKVIRTLSLAFNKCPNSTPPTFPIDTSETLTRSTKALAPINQNLIMPVAHASKVEEMTKSELKPSVSPSPYDESFKPMPINLAFSGRNPNVTFKGVNINASMMNGKISGAPTGTKPVGSQSQIKTFFQAKGTRDRWLQKNGKKALNSGPLLSPWTCLRCSHKFPTQQTYMYHSCQRPKKNYHI